MSARASRTENQDAIDAAIVGMLADPKEVYFLFVCPVMQNIYISVAMLISAIPVK